MQRYLYTLLILLSAFSYRAAAQTNLQGRVTEYQTHVHLQSIRITNLNTKQFAVTDTAGIFYISAKPGDLLAIRGYAYKPDTVAIINKNRLDISLQPVTNLLNEVKVSTTEATVGNMHDPSLNGAPVVYQRDAQGYAKGGVALRFGYGKDKKALHNKKLSDEEAADYEIDQAFNEKTVGKTIPLRGQELKDFIIMYRPERKVFKDPGFNMTAYLNDNYKIYLALPPDKRKPADLKADTVGN